MAGEYGVNIKFRAIGLSQIDKATAKAKELENSVSKIRSLDLGKAIRGPVGDEIAEATGQIRRYAKQVNQTGKVVGNTRKQQMAALESFEMMRDEVQIGSVMFNEMNEAIANQTRLMNQNTNSTNKNVSAKKKQKMFPGMSQGFLGNLREGVMGGGALQSGLVSGAFPLLFGQGPLGGAAGFAGGFLGTKMGGQMGGFAGGLVATAVLQQLTTAKEKLEELGKAVTFFSFDVSAATNALGLAGTPQAEYIKLIEKSQGKQAAFNLVMQDMEKLVGEDGVKALQDFAEGTRELQSEITRFLTEVAANVAKLFAAGDGSGRVTGLSRRSLLKDALTSDNLEIQSLIEKRNETKNRNKREKINQEILKLMQTEKNNKKNLDLENLRAEQYREITKSVTDKNRFLNESISLGTREAQIQEKLREFDRKALQFDKEINQQKRDQFENALRLQQELERVNNLYQGIANTVQSGLVDAIEGAINGTKTLGDVARSVFGAIQRQLIDFAATSFLRAIPGIGGFFANGGVTIPNKSYIVGERGPELFTPGITGRVTPNHELGGSSTNVVVNVDASGSSVEGDEAQGRELGRLISVAVQSEIVQQQRPGGLLA